MKPLARLGLLLLALSAWLACAGPSYAQTAGSMPGASTASQSQDPSASSPGPAAMPDASHPSGSPGPSLPFGIDLGQLTTKVFNIALYILFDGFAEALKDMVGGVMASQVNVITQTPPSTSYQSSAVLSLWGTVRGVANLALALVAAWAGLDLMIREHIGSPYHEVMEILPRLALGALLVNTSLSWSQLVIDLENGLCGLIGQVNLPGWQDVTVFESGQVVFQAVAALIYLVTSLLLLLQMYMRLALVDLLLVTSPVALLCWVLPQTQRWSSLWSSTFFGAVFAQFAQVIALKLGDALMNDLSIPVGDARLLALFLGVGLMFLTIKIPAIIGRSAGDGLGFTRFLIYRQAARAVSGGGGG